MSKYDGSVNVMALNGKYFDLPYINGDQVHTILDINCCISAIYVGLGKLTDNRISNISLADLKYFKQLMR